MQNISKAKEIIRNKYINRPIIFSTGMPTSYSSRYYKPRIIQNKKFPICCILTFAIQIGRALNL